MKEIPLSRGMVALVDDGDYEAVVAAGPWHLNPSLHTSYARRNCRIDGRKTTQSLHGFLMGAPWVDHVNGDGLDNQRSNLRPATAAQNAANRRVRVDATSGYKGVTRNSRGLPWKAGINVRGHKVHLGCFATAEEAARAYDVAATDAWGAFARTNFVAEGIAA